MKNTELSQEWSSNGSISVTKHDMYWRDTERESFQSINHEMISFASIIPQYFDKLSRRF